MLVALAPGGPARPSPPLPAAPSLCGEAGGKERGGRAGAAETPGAAAAGPSLPPVRPRSVWSRRRPRGEWALWDGGERAGPGAERGCGGRGGGGVLWARLLLAPRLYERLVK